MNFIERIDRICEDNQSGSTTILNNIIDAIYQYLHDETYVNTEVLNNTFDRILQTFPSFAVVIHFVLEAKKVIKQVDTDTENCDSENRECIIDFLNRYYDTWNNITKRIAQNVYNQIDFQKKTMLLHSNSLAIHEIGHYLSSIKEFPRIYQTVSYPAGEGISQGKYFAELGFEVFLISEAAVGKYMYDIDFVIFGADSIFTDIFINKIGSFQIALSCDYYQKDVFVVSDSRKLVDEFNTPMDIQDAMKGEKAKSANELLEENIDGIFPLNYYFEEVPCDLVTRFIFEHNNVQQSSHN